MRNLLLIGIVVGMFSFMCGCTSTKTTIYSKDGTIERVIESDTNPLQEGVLNLRDKIVIVIKDNLEIGIEVTMDAENPIPHGSIIFNNGLVVVSTIPKDVDPLVLKQVVELVKAFKGKVTVNFKGLKTGE
jgi:hypothetical protein